MIIFSSRTRWFDGSRDFEFRKFYTSRYDYVIQRQRCEINFAEVLWAQTSQRNCGIVSTKISQLSSHKCLGVIFECVIIFARKDIAKLLLAKISRHALLLSCMCDNRYNRSSARYCLCVRSRCAYLPRFLQSAVDTRVPRVANIFLKYLNTYNVLLYNFVKF